MVTCEECGLTYAEDIASDVRKHSRRHEKYLLACEHFGVAFLRFHALDKPFGRRQKQGLFTLRDAVEKNSKFAGVLDVLHGVLRLFRVHAVSFRFPGGTISPVSLRTTVTFVSFTPHSFATDSLKILLSVSAISQMLGSFRNTPPSTFLMLPPPFSFESSFWVAPPSCLWYDWHGGRG